LARTGTEAEAAFNTLSIQQPEKSWVERFGFGADSSESNQQHISLQH
jgi:hypothetical protein